MFLMMMMVMMMIIISGGKLYCRVKNLLARPLRPHLSGTHKLSLRYIIQFHVPILQSVLDILGMRLHKCIEMLF